MRKVYVILSLLMLACFGCEWQLKPGDDKSDDGVVVARYDRIESLYLTTGDFSALQHMNTSYPMQTRTLIEDVLQLGRVNDPSISTKFLTFFQDTTLQMLLADIQVEYADMDDVNRQLADGFKRLQSMLPNLELPQVYAQISALDQSVIVGDGILGISLDKYMGADYPLYQKFGYSDSQRSTMNRANIVPDCLGFYLLSLYPMPFDRELTQQERDVHVGKIQWVVNRAMNRKFFTSDEVRNVERYMSGHKHMSVPELLNFQTSISI